MRSHLAAAAPPQAASLTSGKENWTKTQDFVSPCLYRTQVNLGSDLWVRMSVRKRHRADLTDVTLADEDTNSILTDNANRTIQGNEEMQVM